MKLISFVTCPFVQRAVILLRERNIEHEVEYIDLGNPPEWFAQASPRGRVPILFVKDTSGDNRVLFESQTICEYLDEVSTAGERLTPTDPIERAMDRAWFTYSEEDLLMPLYQILYGTNPKALTPVYSEMQESLRSLEETMKGRQFLSGNGKKFGLADVAIAPFFFKADLFKQQGWESPLVGFENLQAWSARILERPSVQGSVRADCQELTLKDMNDADAWILNHRLSELNRV